MEPVTAATSTSRRRSFKAIQYELPPFMKAKERPNPLTIQNFDTDVNQLDGWLSKCEDLVWSVLRYQCSQETEQVIPGWKGFFYEITEETDDKHVVGYLPTIRKSPTKNDTVQEVLLLCKEKAESLNLTETDLVLDHAIYSKAVEIIMMERNADLRAFVNLRMGGFHAACIFLCVIGKRFADAGLKDIIVESALVGEDSAQQVLKGKHYNNAMRVHMYVAEAITRIRLDAFEDWLKKTNKFEEYTNIIKEKALTDLKECRSPQHFKDCMQVCICFCFFFCIEYNF